MADCENKKAIYADDLFRALIDDINISGVNLARVKRHIDNAPAVDAVEVVHGRWEYMHDSIFNCTNCGSIHIVETSMGNPKWRYCPNCGAKMDGDGNG